jgi:hypothetical protein
MKDIIPPSQSGLDAGALDTLTPRATNILSIQIGALEYAPDFGIDLKYFLSEDFKFQDSSFKAYLIQILANYSINVASIEEVVENLYKQYNFNIVPAETQGALIAR